MSSERSFCEHNVEEDHANETSLKSFRRHQRYSIVLSLSYSLTVNRPTQIVCVRIVCWRSLYVLYCSIARTAHTLIAYIHYTTFTWILNIPLNAFGTRRIESIEWESFCYCFVLPLSKYSEVVDVVVVAVAAFSFSFAICCSLLFCAFEFDCDFCRWFPISILSTIQLQYSDDNVNHDTHILMHSVAVPRYTLVFSFGMKMLFRRNVKLVHESNVKQKIFQFFCGNFRGCCFRSV